MPDNPDYVLGHSQREIERLRLQARLLEPVTRRFFLEAGVASGMRVLDIGSGAGDVAFLAAELVGPAGAVIGMDRAAKAVASATHAARERGLANVSFREGDPAELAFTRPFDAVVGRYVLLFQADAAAMLRQLVRHLRPGGLVLFHEPDWVGVRSIPPAPTYDHCCAWIRRAFRLAGTDADMADKLLPIFVGAGLTAPAMRMQTHIAAPAGASDLLHSMADLAASLVPAMERHGVATAAEVAPDTLAERLVREVTVNGSLVIWRSEIAAWARL